MPPAAGDPADGAPPGTDDHFGSSVLLALPQLVDDNFRRSVILLASHDPDGAMGFTMNRPLPASVGEVLEGLGLAWQGPAEAVVWSGGPVMPQAGWVLYTPERGSPPADAREVLPGLFLTASIDTLRSLAARPPRRFRLLLGYAGWGSGQLESEVREGSWFVANADARFLFETAAELLWPKSFEQIGIAPGLIVPGHGVQ